MTEDGTVNALRARREELDLTQVQVAELAGVHRVTVRAAETGKDVEPRNLANIRRVLGCVGNPPTQYGADAAGGLAAAQPLVPVLSARTAGSVVRALSRLDATERTAAGRDYFALVDAVHRGQRGGSAGDLLGEWFERFRDELKQLMTVGEVVALDGELAEVFGADYQHRAALSSQQAATLIAADLRARGFNSGDPQVVPASNPAAQAIAASGLPAQVQGALFEHLGRRREQTDAAILAEIRTMIESLYRMSDG